MSDLSINHLQVSHKKTVIQIVVLILSFLWMMVWNTLANGLPLNGYSTGAVSALYKNEFVPAGFTFSIWGIIYVLLIGWIFSAALILWRRPSTDFRWRHVLSILFYFNLSCFLNGSWIIAWHYLQVALSAGIMICLWFVLWMIYQRMQTYQSAITGLSRVFLYHSFVVYFAWISVALIANVTALLVDCQWNGWGLPASFWSILMITIAFLIGVFMSLFRSEPAFVLVFAWAFLGIGKGQQNGTYWVSTIAYAAAGLSLLLTFIAWWKRTRKETIDGVL